MTFLRLSCGAIALAALVSAPVAQAQQATGVATELFNAGRDLMKAGDYRTACPKLEESARLDAKVGTLARLAECEEKIGHMVSARAHWEQALNLANAQHDDRATHVKSELSRLDGLVPKLSLSVEGTPPADLRIRIDDLDVGLGSLGVPLPVEPGTHHVVASAAGKTSWSGDVVASQSGAVVAVHIPVLVAEPIAPPVAVVVAPAQPKETPHGLRPVETAGIIVAGAGVVGIAVGSVFGLVASHKNSESNAQPGGCNAGGCPPAAYALRNDARSAGDVSTAFFVVGGALVAGGAAMWIVAPKRGASTTVALLPLVGPRGGALSFGGSF